MAEGTVYFRDGELVGESGNAKVYKMNDEHFLEIGPGHNLVSAGHDIVDYIWQINDRPYGNCLIIGLGLGIAAQYVLSLPKVNSLTVIEENVDTIKVQSIINPITESNLKIVNGEILPYLYQTSELFDFVFIDCYTIVDEETLPFIADIATGASKVLKRGGTLAGWLDNNTPEEFIDPFFKLFDIDNY